GPHHEAQKLSTTALPRVSASEKWPPSSRSRVKLGAVGRLPSATWAETVVALSIRPLANSPTSSTKTVTATACRVNRSGLDTPAGYSLAPSARCGVLHDDLVGQPLDRGAIVGQRVGRG